MSWKTCGNCNRSGTAYCDLCHRTTVLWRAIYCEKCGGVLSEVREHKIKTGNEEVIRHYRHCFSCHMEFYEEEE